MSNGFCCPYQSTGETNWYTLYHHCYRLLDKMEKGRTYKSESEPTLYTKVDEQGQMLIACLYVDDLIFTGDYGIADFKAVMESKFEMTDMGLMKCFLGIEVRRSEGGIFISETKYASEVLKRFNMSNCETAPTPVITGLKLRKDDEGSTVDPTCSKGLLAALCI